jgi:hypothetical protein
VSGARRATLTLAVACAALAAFPALSAAYAIRVDGHGTPTPGGGALEVWVKASGPRFEGIALAVYPSRCPAGGPDYQANMPSQPADGTLTQLYAPVVNPQWQGRQELCVWTIDSYGRVGVAYRRPVTVAAAAPAGLRGYPQASGSPNLSRSVAAVVATVVLAFIAAIAGLVALLVVRHARKRGRAAPGNEDRGRQLDEVRAKARRAAGEAPQTGPAGDAEAPRTPQAAQR